MKVKVKVTDHAESGTDDVELVVTEDLPQGERLTHPRHQDLELLQRLALLIVCLRYNITEHILLITLFYLMYVLIMLLIFFSNILLTYYFSSVLYLLHCMTVKFNVQIIYLNIYFINLFIVLMHI